VIKITLQKKNKVLPLQF